jgi:hypothetical protein
MTAVESPWYLKHSVVFAFRTVLRVVDVPLQRSSNGAVNAWGDVN